MKIQKKKELNRIRITSHNKPLLYTIIFLIIILIAVVITINFLDDEKLVGGDKDEHGCLITAGYSWNETKKECVREWEEREKELRYCEIDSDCVKNSCCHASSCVNINSQPDCTNIVCTQICETILDCNQASCRCIDNRCEVYMEIGSRTA